MTSEDLLWHKNDKQFVAELESTNELDINLHTKIINTMLSRKPETLNDDEYASTPMAHSYDILCHLSPGRNLVIPISLWNLSSINDLIWLYENWIYAHPEKITGHVTPTGNSEVKVNLTYNKEDGLGKKSVLRSGSEQNNIKYVFDDVLTIAGDQFQFSCEDGSFLVLPIKSDRPHGVLTLFAPSSETAVDVLIHINWRFYRKLGCSLTSSIIELDNNIVDYCLDVSKKHENSNTSEKALDIGTVKDTCRDFTHSVYNIPPEVLIYMQRNMKNVSFEGRNEDKMLHKDKTSSETKNKLINLAVNGATDVLKFISKKLQNG